MRKKQVKIEVNQSIVYADTKQQDNWHFQVVGDLLELETFSKLSYENEQGQPVVVKWQIGEEANQWIVEIKQGGNQLRFNPKQVTRAQYRTEQGVLLLTIHTSSIRWGWEQAKNGHTRRRLTVDYQLLVDDTSVGDYRYVLTYTD
ncbi:DUF1934 domain-containing protein [Aerococcaceae bacterium NML190938]|nr:DUF1934 domain-containing protein [Aerococcaceae bacterium NML190938]